jgi:hypothetical protein
MKKFGSEKMGVCCALLLLYATAAIAQDSTALLPEKDKVASARNALEAKKNEQDAKKSSNSFCRYYRLLCASGDVCRNSQ